MKFSIVILLALISSCATPASSKHCQGLWVFQNQDGNVFAINTPVTPAEVKPAEVSLVVESGIVSRKKILHGAANFNFVCVQAEGNLLVSADKLNFASHVHTTETSVYVYSRTEGAAAVNVSIDRCINEKDFSFPPRDIRR